MSLLLDFLRAAGGIALMGGLWLLVQHFARKQDQLPPDQDMLQRACIHCAHKSAGCSAGNDACPY